jgi:putative sterol carrier protein
VENSPNVPLEDRNVPVAHQGLHEFLYSAADEHGTTSASPQLELAGDEIFPVAAWQSLAENVRVAGVYAVLDSAERTQYVGYSRNVLTSLKGHLAEHGSDICAYVKVRSFKFPKREEMEQLRDSWIAALAEVPLGNTGTSSGWATTVREVAQAAMSPAERAAYEEKKLKLRRAMADTELSKEAAAASITDERQRENFAAAMNDDNWSAVIQGQTAETI